MVFDASENESLPFFNVSSLFEGGSSLPVCGCCAPTSGESTPAHKSDQFGTPAAMTASRCIRRNSTMLLWSEYKRPRSHINSTFRRHSTSKRHDERISSIAMEFLLGFRPWLVSQPIRPPSTRLGPTPVRRMLVPCGRSPSELARSRQ